MDARVLKFSTELERAVKTLVNQKLGREALLVIMHNLQHHLACDTSGRYPHSESLELIIRALIGVLNRQNKDYVWENLRPGTAGLINGLGIKPDL